MQSQQPFESFAKLASFLVNEVPGLALQISADPTVFRPAQLVPMIQAYLAQAKDIPWNFEQAVELPSGQTGKQDWLLLKISNQNPELMTVACELLNSKRLAALFNPSFREQFQKAPGQDFFLIRSKDPEFIWAIYRHALAAFLIDRTPEERERFAEFKQLADRLVGINYHGHAPMGHAGKNVLSLALSSLESSEPFFIVAQNDCMVVATLLEAFRRRFSLPMNPQRVHLAHSAHDFYKDFIQSELVLLKKEAQLLAVGDIERFFQLIALSNISASEMLFKIEWPKMLEFVANSPVFTGITEAQRTPQMLDVWPVTCLAGFEKIPGMAKEVPPRELAISLKLKHPNIVRFLTGFSHQFQAPGLSWLLMARYEMDLQTYLSNNHDLSTRRPYLGSMSREIAEAIVYLHARKIVHGDIKPNNIGVQIEKSGAPLCLLGDFGSAQENGVPGVSKITPCAASLEQLKRFYVAQANGDRSAYQLKPEDDVFAFALVVLALYAGSTFLDRQSNEDAVQWQMGNLYTSAKTAGEFFKQRFVQLEALGIKALDTFVAHGKQDDLLAFFLQEGIGDARQSGNSPGFFDEPKSMVSVVAAGLLPEEFRPPIGSFATLFQKVSFCDRPLVRQVSSSQRQTFV